MNQFKHANEGTVEPLPGTSKDAGRFDKQLLNQALHHLVSELISHGVDLQFAKKELEAVYITQILRKHGGNIGHSAKVLGIHRNTLSKRIRDLAIDQP